MSEETEVLTHSGARSPRPSRAGLSARALAALTASGLALLAIGAVIGQTFPISPAVRFMMNGMYEPAAVPKGNV